jgi:hypothetical protein
MTVGALSPALQAQVRPLLERWPPFVEKWRVRVAEAFAEAESGLDALVAEHATDLGPMGAAFGALQARFRGLVQKLDEAAEKIEGVLDDLGGRDDVGRSDRKILFGLRDEMIETRRRLSDELDAGYETLHMRKNAAWARKLYEHAAAETRTELPCSECGSPFQIRVFWQASNETCPHCRAMNSLMPGAATYTYFSQGVHALAHEAAFEAALGERRARALLDAQRGDFEGYVAAARGYWTRYYQAYASLHPGFTAAFGSIEQAVAAKLAHYRP